MNVPRPADVDRFLQGVGRDALIDLLWRAAVAAAVDAAAPDVEGAASAVIVRPVKERGGHGGEK